MVLQRGINIVKVVFTYFFMFLISLRAYVLSDFLEDIIDNQNFNKNFVVQDFLKLKSSCFIFFCIFYSLDSFINKYKINLGFFCHITL
jgi:hypothetical protein